MALRAAFQAALPSCGRRIRSLGLFFKLFDKSLDALCRLVHHPSIETNISRHKEIAPCHRDLPLLSSVGTKSPVNWVKPTIKVSSLRTCHCATQSSSAWNILILIMLALVK